MTTRAPIPSPSSQHPDAYTTESVGVLLRELRQSAGLSQEALGRKLGKVKGAISNVERGATNIDVPDTASWATACGRRLIVAFVPADAPTAPDAAVADAHLRAEVAERRAVEAEERAADAEARVEELLGTLERLVRLARPKKRPTA